MSVLPKQLEAKEFLGEGAEERAWSVHGACTEHAEPSSLVPEIFPLTSVIDFPKAERRSRRWYLSRQGDLRA